MSGKPAARITDPTVCPVSGHGTNSLVSGSSDVIFEGLGAARLNDTSACGSAITGGVSSTVFINGFNAATVDSIGAHGNTVTAGASTIIIGDAFVPAPFSGLLPMPVHFSDKIKLVDEATGESMPNHAYGIQRADGSIEHGVSDALGYTHVVSSHLAESVKLFLED
ncbi:PAAR domain-containing protein [Pseudomonas sp. MWU13-2100]|uniref:PAAR domain-containing protein n=1 Tax=Pseudomonas sp. MWU13-2100 TaxID=2935075 RepID=UPI002010A2B0|nr:PAAR domain-containing protein [Pseudomonas sp. MWU13-2100]